MPRYSKEFISEIKHKLKVSDVVNKFVKLTRRGNEFIGLSPFKAEKTPSFTVNDDKEFYHCFSTSALPSKTSSSASSSSESIISNPASDNFVVYCSTCSEVNLSSGKDFLISS